jgi:Trp operon repressor
MRVHRLVDPLGLLPRAGRAGAHAQAVVVDATGRLALVAVRRLGAWPYASAAVEVAVASPAVERAVCAFAEGPLTQRVVDRLFEGALPQRMVERLLADGIAEQIAARLLDGPELERLAAQTIADPATAQLVERAVGSPGTEDLLTRVLDSDGMERLVARVINSQLVEVAVAHLLAGEELWRVIDEIAQSPAVTEAISHQGAGFADQVAGEVGERSRHADAWLERTARRLLRRTPGATGPPMDVGLPGTGPP